MLFMPWATKLIKSCFVVILIEILFFSRNIIYSFFFALIILSGCIKEKCEMLDYYECKIFVLFPFNIFTIYYFSSNLYTNFV